MSKFDVPRRVLACQFFGKVSGSGTGFDGDVDVVAEWCDYFEDGFGIVLNGLIGEYFPLLIHDAGLNGIGMLVNSNENW
jgi:hypothetical protein